MDRATLLTDTFSGLYQKQCNLQESYCINQQETAFQTFIFNFFFTNIMMGRITNKA